MKNLARENGTGIALYWIASDVRPLHKRATPIKIPADESTSIEILPRPGCTKSEIHQDLRAFSGRPVTGHSGHKATCPGGFCVWGGTVTKVASLLAGSRIKSLVRHNLREYYNFCLSSG